MCQSEVLVLVSNNARNAGHEGVGFWKVHGFWVIQSHSAPLVVVVFCFIPCIAFGSGSPCLVGYIGLLVLSR